MKRGRPKKIVESSPDMFIREYINDDGTKEIWTYNLKISQGPISVEIFDKPKNNKKYGRN
jgi:hypothetical protein